MFFSVLTTSKTTTSTTVRPDSSTTLDDFWIKRLNEKAYYNTFGMVFFGIIVIIFIAFALVKIVLICDSKLL